MSSQDRTAQHALTAVLRGGPAPSAPAAQPRPAFVDLVPQRATSTHQQAVATALAGTPLRVDVGSEGGTFLAGLLAALTAAGRAVTLVPGPATDPARDELRALGLGHLLAGTEEDPTRRGAGLPPADPARWNALLRDLTARDRAWFGGEGTASRFDALSALAALRAEHLHPPLLPRAAEWSTADRARITSLLANAPRTGEDPLRAHSDDEIARILGAADTLTTLPESLDRLADLTARLTREASWRPPTTLADLDAVAPVLDAVDRALRTYVPAALHTDLDAARAILGRQPRSLLSAEERERRRELKRLAALRHDGATFGPADVDALQAVQTAWTAHADGAPRSWAAHAELQQTLQVLRQGLATVAPLFPHETDLAALSVLAQRLRDAATAVARRKDRAAITSEGLDDLLDAIPSGSRPEEIARLVDGTHWRALTEGTAMGAAGAATSDDLVRDFTRLDDLRRARAARELQLALAGARATPVQLDGDAPQEPTDVLVVDGADHLDPATVAARSQDAALTILLGTPGHDGSAWAAAGPAVATVTLAQHVKPAELAAGVADALRAAGLPVVDGVDSDLQIGGLLVDLDATHGTLPVQDREIARAARLRQDSRPRYVVRSADWFTDHRKATRAVVEAYEALAPAAPAAPEPAAAPAPSPVLIENFPKGMGTADAAQTAVAEFLAALAGGNPNIDQTPSTTLDAAIALAYADLGLTATDQQVLDAAMERLTYRRRGTKVLRAFKEALQRSQKKMRGAGVKLG